jgi:hypothetical protein
MSRHGFGDERRRKTLDELEGVKWGPPEDNSFLVTRCHALRKKPIGEFDVEDLRIMIGQQIGLFFLVPLALEKLVRKPLGAGDFYPGDLLGAVLRIDAGFWHCHADWKRRLDAILAKVRMVPKTIEADVRSYRSGTPSEKGLR